MTSRIWLDGSFVGTTVFLSIFHHW